MAPNSPEAGPTSPSRQFSGSESLLDVELHALLPRLSVERRLSRLVSKALLSRLSRLAGD